PPRAARPARRRTRARRRLPHLARPGLRRRGRLPVPLRLLPHRHLRAPPRERSPPRRAPLLAAHLQAPAPARGGDDPAHAAGDRAAAALLDLADDHAAGRRLRRLPAERAAGGDAGRLPRPGRGGRLPAAALLASVASATGVHRVAAAVPAGGAPGPRREIGAPPAD